MFGIYVLHGTPSFIFYPKNCDLNSVCVNYNEYDVLFDENTGWISSCTDIKWQLPPFSSIGSQDLRKDILYSNVLGGLSNPQA